MLRCVICTALGDPVEPDVSCISARSSSPVSTGSIGSAASRSATMRTFMPFSSSTGIATRNGSETMTALSSIMPMTVMVSSAHTDADRCAGSAGAAWSGSRRASTRPERSARSPPGSRPARRRRRHGRCRPRPVHPRCGGRARAPRPRCGGPGSYGSPVTMPRLLSRALRYILSVNRLTTTLALGVGGRHRRQCDLGASFARLSILRPLCTALSE